MDLAIKYRFFKNVLSGGSDEDAERVYRWHIGERSGKRMLAGVPTDAWKLSLDDYVGSARNLLCNMEYRGFIPEFAVPVDPAGELLQGSHRVACAIALGIKEIPIRRETRYAWAPAWGFEWFMAHGLNLKDLDRALDDFRDMRK